MNNPEELLRKARHLWDSDQNAFRAQQILNGIMKDYPDSPEAQSAKELRDLIARSPAPGESFSESEEGREGWRHTVQENAFAIILGLIAIFIAWRWKVAATLVIAMMMAAFLVILVFVPGSVLEKILRFLSKRR